MSADLIYTEINHPLIAHKLGILRDKHTPSWLFRTMINELSVLLIYEALRDVKSVSEETEIWSGKYIRKKIPADSLAFISVLRAGIGMLDAAVNLFPKAPVCFIGIARNEEDARPVSYYQNIVSDIAQRTAVIIDPMLATGGSLVNAVNILKKHGCKSFKAVSAISAPEGIAYVNQKTPEVQIYTGCLDERLNERFFIIPGLGDAGDRYFGTDSKN